MNTPSVCHRRRRTARPGTGPGDRPGAVALAIAALLAGLAAPPAAQAVVTYDLIDLSAFGPVAGLPGIATGINNAGNIVGNGYDANGQESGGWFLAAGATQWTALPKVGGSLAEVRAVAIDNSNRILGASLGRYPVPHGPIFIPEEPRPATWQVPVAGPFLAGSRVGMPPAGWEPLAMNDNGALLVRGTVATPGSVTKVVVDRLTNGVATRIWESQGYPTTMPLAINNAGDTVGGLAYDTLLGSDYGIRYTALNNTGLRIGLRWVAPFQPAAPVLTWFESDGAPVFGTPNIVERTVDLNTLVTPGQGSMAFVTAINDQGQIVGQSSSGHAALLTLGGSLQLVAVPANPGPNNPFPGQKVLKWDTALERLPNWQNSGDIAVVIAPNDPAGAFIFNGPFSNAPLGDLDNARIKSLTVGNVGLLAPGTVFTTVGLSSMSLQITTGAVTVGRNAQLRLDNSSIDAPQGGVVNLGALTMGGVVLRGSLANHGGSVTVDDGSMVTVQGDVVNDLPLGAAPFGGQALRVNTGARLVVVGEVQNTSNVQVLSGGRLQAHRFTQTAGQLVVNGGLDTFGDDVVITGGGLYGNGVINAVHLTVGTNGPHTGAHPFIAPGNSPGHLTVNGQFVLGANGTLELQVERGADGSLAWDRLTATSMSFLDGSTVHLVVGSGVAGAQWQTLAFLDCGSGCTFGSGVGLVVDGAPGATVRFGSGGLTLDLAPAQAVPEPATAALWLAGLLAVGRLARRRSRA